MATETDNTSSHSGSQGSANNKTVDEQVDDETYKQMLDILKDLTDHTHTFYDDYGTACQCNCLTRLLRPRNCNCTCKRVLEAWSGKTRLVAAA